MFFFTTNHLQTRAPLSDIHAAGFGPKTIVLVIPGITFSRVVFRLADTYFPRDWTGVTRTDWSTPQALHEPLHLQILAQTRASRDPRINRQSNAPIAK